MTNKFQQRLGVTADGKSILKSDRKPAGLAIARVGSSKTRSVAMPTLTASALKLITAEELSSALKPAKQVNPSKVNDGERNLFFRTSPRQAAMSMSSVQKILSRMMSSEDDG